MGDERASAAKTEAAPAAKQPTIKFIRLEQRYGEWHGGQVVPADEDLLGRMKVEGVKFRPATASEIGIAGFPQTL